MTLAAVMVILGLQHLRNRELAEKIGAMTQSRSQISLAVEFDRAFDRQLEFALGDQPDDKFAQETAEAHRVLAALRGSTEHEMQVGELWLIAELESLQAVLETNAASARRNLETIEMARDSVVDIVHALLEHEQHELSDASISAVGNDSLMALLSIAAAGMLALALLVGIVGPLRRYVMSVIDTTRRIASGDLKTPVRIPGPRDLAELGEAIELMRTELHDKLGIEARIQESEQFGRALRASEERYRTLFDVSPLPTWVFDSETLALRAANRALLDLTGYSPSELEQMHVTDLLEDCHSKPARLRSKQGVMIEVDITSHTIQTDQGVCTLSVGVDVTEARRVEEQLRQAQKMEAIGQLAGGVAHDFNNILAVIQMNAELLAMDLGSDHASADDVREIAIASERGARLTRQLLAFSRKQIVSPRPLAVNAVISDLEKMLTRVVGEHIEIETSQSSRTGVINVDPGQLEQVVMNLVVNARDAMPNGGRLTIETSAVDLAGDNATTLGLRRGRYAVITVADEGCGMDAATKAHIFEPFFTTKEVGKGTGLGLANVFGIVSQGGGAVTVDSELGGGSIFRVYFPRIGDRLTEATQAVADQPLPTDSRTVLVVEDEDAVRAAIKRLLTSWGHQCIEARNGDTALELIRSANERIDLLITDLVMPGMSGNALVTQARAVRPDLKVLMMSGYTEHPSIKHDAEHRGETFVAKPFSALSFSTAMQEALADKDNDTSAILLA
jgi:signal transduction histidine kinase/ActR/RegA family two-component response regulator